MRLVPPFHLLCIFVTFAFPLALKSTRAEQRSLVVQTKAGAVVGKIKTLPHGNSVDEYLGIPYAEPPVGKLRFAAPKPAKPWSGIKKAMEFGASCSMPLVPGMSASSMLFCYIIKLK